MDKKRILIIGASGLVGSYLFRFFSNIENLDVKGTYCKNQQSLSLDYLNIKDRREVKNLLEKFNPDVIFFPAAIPSVEYCEEAVDETRIVNIEPVKDIIDFIKNRKTKFIYFSTDYVFDGKSGLYSETDATNPINEYGKQKLEVEEYIKEKLEDYLIIRTTGVFGWHKGGKNFVLQILSRLKEGQEMKVPSDQIHSPTYAEDLSRAIYKLILQNKIGIFNVVNNGIMPRVEFAKLVAEVFGFDKDNILPIKTEELNLKAKRPHNTGLRLEKLLSCDMRMPTQKEALEEMKEKTIF